MRCPDCGQYSLTYDWPRHGYVCWVYRGFIPAEDDNQELAYRFANQDKTLQGAIDEVAGEL